MRTSIKTLAAALVLTTITLAFPTPAQAAPARPSRPTATQSANRGGAEEPGLIDIVKRYVRKFFTATTNTDSPDSRPTVPLP
ncbi:MAG TPA: hypothetical protein VFN10_20715 [Thermoanaerobaculia bacterium]|nr:hypothetical protein [Thermoanaerobaculia bacterium]